MQSPSRHSQLADFNASPRLAYMSGIAVAVGVVAAFLALLLLRLIAFFTNQSLNWGMAAALSVLLLVTTLVLLVFCSRLSGRRELALR